MLQAGRLRNGGLGICNLMTAWHLTVNPRLLIPSTAAWSN